MNTVYAIVLATSPLLVGLITLLFWRSVSRYFAWREARALRDKRALLDVILDPGNKIN